VSGPHQHRTRKFVCATVPAIQSRLMLCVRLVRPPMTAGPGYQPPLDSGYCCNIRNPWPTNFSIDGSNSGERALFHSFSATRQTTSRKSRSMSVRRARAAVGTWSSSRPSHAGISPGGRSSNRAAANSSSHARCCHLRSNTLLKPSFQREKPARRTPIPQRSHPSDMLRQRPSRSPHRPKIKFPIDRCLLTAGSFIRDFRTPAGARNSSGKRSFASQDLSDGTVQNKLRVNLSTARVRQGEGGETWAVIPEATATHDHAHGSDAARWWMASRQAPRLAAYGDVRAPDFDCSRISTSRDRRAIISSHFTPSNG
jgi:hypothetical protein